jgi:hypothetical protein
MLQNPAFRTNTSGSIRQTFSKLLVLSIDFALQTGFPEKTVSHFLNLIKTCSCIIPLVSETVIFFVFGLNGVIGIDSTPLYFSEIYSSKPSDNPNFLFPAENLD